MSIQHGIFLPLLTVACLLPACSNNSSSENIAPEEVLGSFEIEQGFKIELIASEPLIRDPVDMEIDEFGRLYVVEMPGYPLDKSGSGKIKLLSDTDGDGRLDKSITFAENLILPNSIMRWKNGVLVTDAPHVLYFEDRNGDGQAEVRDTLLTGFALSNPQHNLNSPMLGIDNWIYLAHEGAVSTETYKEEFGDPGAEIYFPGHPTAARLSKNANGRAVRFNPDKLQLELLSGHTQFGHTFDRWGNYFQVGNANHIYHEMIAERYLQRNPELLLSNATQSVSDHGNAAEVFPITENPQHQLLTDIGVITSACGLTAYTGGAFPSPYNQDVTFVAEPVSNLIHVDKIKDAGATFSASRIKARREFLASTDPKFRPVNMYVGPDGALYVVDYYRQIIEHPEWMGKEVIASGELYNDMDKGRIYRITAEDAGTMDWTTGLKLGNASDEELVKRLSDTNGWWRQNAQRLLVDRKRDVSIPLLNKMTTNASSMGRLHALWTLEGLGKLKPDHIARALQDTVAGVRKNAVKLAELHLSDSPELIQALLSMPPDNNEHVRFQLLCTLGYITSDEANTARQNLLFQDIDDKWMQIAALSAAGDHSSLLSVLVERIGKEGSSHTAVIERLSAMIASKGNKKTIHELIDHSARAEKQNLFEIQGSLLEGLAQGMQRQKPAALLSSAEQKNLIQTFFETSSAPVRKAALHALKALTLDKTIVAPAINNALDVAANRNNPEDKRADAIDFLALQDTKKFIDALMAFFVPQEPLPVQLASLRSMSAIRDTTVSHFLLERWSTLTPQLQDAAVGTFLANEDRIDLLLTAIEKNKIHPSHISWPRRVRLMGQRNENLRNRSRAIFTANNERQVNIAYQPVLRMKGDAVKGKAVYQQNCAICHQIRGEMGVSIGPDLGTIHNWSAEAIMANTLAPNLSISSGYELWSVEMTNGETLQGIIASETPVAITVRNYGSLDKTINRKDIKSLKAFNMSIMPTGLDAQISHAEMADLLAFLKQNK